MRATPFEPVKDVDITRFVSPNLDLVNELLLGRVQPAALTVDSYLRGRYPVTRWLISRLMRRKIAKLQYKYLSGHRCKEVFERYKTYRLLTYRIRGQSPQL
jgi:hypothetical protein